ncbi:hypothetical protein LPJ73_000569 [Coemansia sp. RSA 2703]|nr:hypothetical protein LPJ73_000569 [Coemansia sp. RSA 2703]KAJ2377307.1 hypothetical protein IW150_001461 [Coemansia sp. RSA 2607]KAJ2398047.1 hypothetical protein GGI05_000319 [Coemansia sp. RSA 2603]
MSTENTSTTKLEDGDVSALFPKLTRKDVLSCAFSSWYDKLRHVTFKSVILKPLDPSFIEYLLSDGIILPGDDEIPKFGNKIEDDLSEDDGSDWSDYDDDDSGEKTKMSVNIDSIAAEIRQAISSLGGRVFPRMGWSAPTDASWMSSDKTLQCRNLTEVLTLLKSSDKITEDIDGGSYISKDEMGSWEHELVLRQWCNLYPSMEFRCFVREHELIAISQIEMQHYEFLEGMKDDIEDKISELFDRHVREAIDPENYCFDVYITQESGRAYVIDVKPWSAKIDSCLYLWQEILELKDEETLGLRLFPSSIDGMRHYSNKYAANQFPKDIAREGLQTSIVEFIQKMAIQQANEDEAQSDES